MKFHKVLKKLMKDPKRTFSLKNNDIVEQDLESIEYWLTSNEVSEKERKLFFKNILEAEWTDKDWTEDETT